MITAEEARAGTLSPLELAEKYNQEFIINKLPFIMNNLDVLVKKAMEEGKRKFQFSRPLTTEEEMNIIVYNLRKLGYVVACDYTYHTYYLEW